MEDVEAIEWSLRKPSRRAQKSTPFSAMIRMVAREFRGGEKTIEEIWGEYLEDHPEESRKRRKKLLP